VALMAIAAAVRRATTTFTTRIPSPRMKSTTTGRRRPARGASA
jgi:hypothetical protein